MSTKILVVDNDPDIVEQLAVVLKADGHEVVSAGGREEAEETLLSFKPDLAIVDLMMEQMDSGFMLAHYLQALYPRIPVIILTAAEAATGLSFKAQSKDAQSWTKAARVLDKPVRPEQLRAEVRRLLNHAAPKRHAAGAGGGG